MELRPLNKKGQISLADAPQVVMIVGLVFLVMATIALIGQKFGDAVADNDVSIVNESVTPTERNGGSRLNGGNDCAGNSFAVSNVYNGSTSVIITSGNWTINSATGAFSNDTGEYPASNWLVSYAYKRGGVACNVTVDLNTEIANNTSIAGIVLTISLVGIVLTILIGIFIGVRTRRI